MKSIFALVLTTLIFLLSQLSCKKDDAKKDKLKFDEFNLPYISNKGSNFFGYLLDDQPKWKQGESAVNVRYIESDTTLTFWFDDEDENSLYIELSTPLQTGLKYSIKSYNMRPSPSALYSQNRPNGRFTSVEWWLPYFEEPGYIIILNLDKKKRIITGEFELKVKRQWANKTMAITKGRFDVKYKTYKNIML